MASQQLVQNHINLSQVYPTTFPTIEILLVANKNMREENHQLKSRLHHNQLQLRHQTLTNHRLNHDLWKANYTHRKSIQDRNAIALDEPMDLNIKSRNATNGSTMHLGSVEAESFSDLDRIQSVSYQRKGDINVTDKNFRLDIQSFPFYTSVLEFKNNLIVPPHPSLIQNNNEQEEDCLNPAPAISVWNGKVNHNSVLQVRNPQREFDAKNTIENITRSQTFQANTAPNEEIESINLDPVSCLNRQIVV
ncbi:unnamed protein product [Orchesella dallaii]|uniref:Uncharacterized protein n=1 Tax=Orchesella dallaii TaxID=48710 RepID=A0ABP1RNU6_9HEXA